jgi:hypothetical protein
MPDAFVPMLSAAAVPMVERSAQSPLPLDQTVTMVALDGAPRACQ